MPASRYLTGAAGAAVALAAAALVVPAGAHAARPANAPEVEYVDVSVATVWTSPDSPRPVDHKALTNPVDVPGWIADMSPDQEEGLTSDNITQTQALYGAPVDVLSHQDGWTEVAVPGQPTPKNTLGYPGWVPDNQLTTNSRYADVQARRPFALVDKGLSAWLYDDAARTHKDLQLSVNTRLPVLRRTADTLLVDTPDHGRRWIAASSASVYRSDRQIPTPTGANLVRTAKTFLHQPYLWAGRSGFGVDCSGFTGTVYQLHGITIPRDSGPQAVLGGATAVSRTDLQAGDLIFYSDGGAGSIYHVAMYVGGGNMIEAYDHTTPVRITPVRSDNYWGAVRYLHS